MRTSNRIIERSKIIGDVHVVFMRSKKYKRVISWTTGEVELKFIFLGAKLDRRQRGGEIRKGLRFFKKQESRQLPASTSKDSDA